MLPYIGPEIVKWFLGLDATIVTTDGKALGEEGAVRMNSNDEMRSALDFTNRVRLNQQRLRNHSESFLQFLKKAERDSGFHRELQIARIGNGRTLVWDQSLLKHDVIQRTN